MSFIQLCCERRAKSQVAQEISGRGQRRSRDEKDNQRAGDFRFMKIPQLFRFISFFLLLYFISFSIPFVPTTFTHTHTHDPHPLPTTHDLQLHSKNIRSFQTSFINKEACHQAKNATSNCYSLQPRRQHSRCLSSLQLPYTCCIFRSTRLVFCS